MKGVRIREVTRDDRQAIERLVALGAREAGKRIGPHPAPVRLEDLAVRGCTGLVATAGGHVVGTVAYRVRSGQLHLFNLVVAPAHRNNGIARQLLLALEEIAERSGARRITVQTIAELGVVPLFKAMGYRAKTVKPEFLLSAGRERALTTAYMVKRLGNSPSNTTGER